MQSLHLLPTGLTSEEETMGMLWISAWKIEESCFSWEFVCLFVLFTHKYFHESVELVYFDRLISLTFEGNTYSSGILFGRVLMWCLGTLICEIDPVFII